MIKLYDLAAADDNQRFSPYCWRVRLALAHKGLPVEIIPWRLTEKSVIAFSNQGLVPVIVDGETVVNDSWKIAEYLEQKYPEPSLFGGSQAQALTLFIKHWNDGVLAPSLFPLVILDIYKNLDPKDKPYFRENREQRLGKTLEEFANPSDEQLSLFRANLEPVRKTLNTAAFIGGDQPNFADYIILATLQLGYTISPLKFLEPNDPVFAWREQILALYNNL
ncbi:glutathione S-transferase family protein [Gloeothece verrucosa]|uniref:Glutathione S-transferase domain protein n=1 Tax=Gloeothece verrucosa (strain PCC 7822) TaxID=497965 RepID=E0UJF3_GLOV7|nr:glutathione S-transferase family protein [Gloeothece verrucosa]ADN16971.1 Glutathione S-transferase domain protein [Gloeothece verrucosa PCC 7822]